jgi:hypothetical protein
VVRVTFVFAAAASQPETIDAESLVRALIEGILQAVVTFWPLFLLIGLVALGKLVLGVRRMRRIARSGIKEIDVMDGARVRALPHGAV